MIEIVDFKEEYSCELSKIILSNLYTINIKDHGEDIINEIAKNFTESAIKNNFPKRTKCFVAIKDNEIMGTASIDKFRGDNTGKKYIVLTVFVKLQNHHQGIGKILMEAIENYAISIGVEELIIPASVYACEFYRKLGFDYLDGIKKQNEEKEYMLVKRYAKQKTI